MKNYKYVNPALILIAALILFNSCDDTNPADIQFPTENVSFNKHVQPLFNLKCNYSGCHDDGSRAGGISLTTWTNVTNDPTLVFPFEPESSRLIWSIQNRPGASLMPPLGYQPLIKREIDGIYKWIEEGAKNN